MAAVSRQQSANTELGKRERVNGREVALPDKYRLPLGRETPVADISGRSSGAVPDNFRMVCNLIQIADGRLGLSQAKL